MMPWLTAIIPVHDGEHFLESTLASAAAERPDGVEFLLYDSGDDGGACRRIAEAYADRLALRYVPTPDCKPWTAKTNRGVAEAQGDHVVMLHQDDLWLPGHIAALRAAIAEAPQAVMSVAPSTFIDRNGRRAGTWRLPLAQGLHDGTSVAARLIVQNTIAIPSPVIKRAAWLEVGGMDESLWYTADWDLYLKLAALGPVHVRRVATTGFRLHGSSLTMTGSRRADEFREQMQVVMDRHLPRLPHAQQARQGELARASINANCALAAASPKPARAAWSALCGVLSLGPVGILRFLDQTRLVDRVLPRLRLRLAGRM